MRSFEILVDCNCDLNRDLRKRFGILDEFIKGTINFPDGSSIEGELDYDKFTEEEHFKRIKDNAGKMKTALAPLGNMVSIMSKYASEKVPLLVMALSSAISGSYNATILAAEMVKEDYPDAEIEVFDSLKYCGAIGLLAIKASQLRDEGKSVKQVKEILDQEKYRLHQSGTLDDLFFLCACGRLNKTKAFFGSLAGVQPVADFTYDGKSMPLGTVGKKKVDEIVFNYIEAMIEHPEEQIIIISESVRKEKALRYKKMLEERFHVKEVIIVPVNQTTGCNVGPGLCAAFYFGKSLTPDRSVEMEVFNRLAGKEDK